jgi:hypothetical protein
MSNGSLTELSFNNNDISNNGCKTINEILKTNSTLTKLSFISELFPNK